MSERKDDGSKRVKNIAAVLYLLVLVFVVGGTYLNQQGLFDGFAPPTTDSQIGN
jgi:hypothetical protein